MTFVDTSVLIDAFTGERRLFSTLRAQMDRGNLCALSTMVIYEWRRGPRTDAQLVLQEELFPATESIAFGVEEARLAAEIYRAIRRPRGRETDIAIAASAIVHECNLWTLNHRDFADIPGLTLASLD